MKTKIIFQQSTQTFRIMPQNYWIASVKNKKLIFDIWDGMSKKLLKNPLLKIKIYFSFFKLLSKKQL